MTSGYLLIGAILILGGIIAVSGDRIGTRVGKARLTLFKLRPRQTATLVTIVTGTLISASVLTLIFGASEQLRTGVFDLQKIQRKLSDTKENLNRAIEQKDRFQRELEIARNEQSQAKNQLSGIDKSLKDELLKQSIAAQNFINTKQQLQSVSTQRQDLVREVTELSRNRSDSTAQQQVIVEQVRDIKERIAGLEAAIFPLQERVNVTTSKKAQLQQRLDLTTVEPNLLRQTEQMQIYENTAKKLAQDLEQQTERLVILEVQLQTQQTELSSLKSQIEQLDRKLEVRRAQLKEKDKQYRQLEREFQTRALQLKRRDQQLKKTELQVKTNRQGLASLEKEVNNIEQEYQKIRQGNIGIFRDRILASTSLPASSAAVINKEIDNLLVRANLNALAATNPDNVVGVASPLENRNQKIIEIDPDRVAQAKQQIIDAIEPKIRNRRSYIVRILSTGNYVVGDRNVQIFIDVAPDRQVFARNTKIAAVNVDPIAMSEVQIRQQLNVLLIAAQLRARRAGILEDRPQIGDGQLATYVQFLELVKKQKYPIEIVAIVDRDTNTLGPLVIKLQAIANGNVLFSTYSNAEIER
ncbi:DUF3084 domain-containing protein [Chamaesiphon sp. VAR_48_metabat_403]|uniref:DUF3084 domain-containing protein n=1 Tax=Chamaesiphon sp. VAR_48_metabat_403 TaxID=2964700 RepID=UPI00286E5AE5|nr:DUF3084 domain-containing protein [Chamaesiphon sp. VAR_48_metabat_403]